MHRRESRADDRGRPPQRRPAGWPRPANRSGDIAPAHNLLTAAQGGVADSRSMNGSRCLRRRPFVVHPSRRLADVRGFGGRGAKPPSPSALYRIVTILRFARMVLGRAATFIRQEPTNVTGTQGCSSRAGRPILCGWRKCPSTPRQRRSRFDGQRCCAVLLADRGRSTESIVRGSVGCAAEYELRSRPNGVGIAIEMAGSSSR